MEVVVFAILLQVAEDRFRICVGPVRQKDHVLSVMLFFTILGIDDECTGRSGLLLSSAMTVIPIRSILSNRYAINEGLTRLNSRKANPWNTIHLRGHTNTMPMYRCWNLKTIG